MRRCGRAPALRHTIQQRYHDERTRRAVLDFLVRRERELHEGAHG